MLSLQIRKRHYDAAVQDCGKPDIHSTSRCPIAMCLIENGYVDFSVGGTYLTLDREDYRISTPSCTNYWPLLEANEEFDLELQSVDLSCDRQRQEAADAGIQLEANEEFDLELHIAS